MRRCMQSYEFMYFYFTSGSGINVTKIQVNFLSYPVYVFLFYLGEDYLHFLLGKKICQMDRRNPDKYFRLIFLS